MTEKAKTENETPDTADDAPAAAAADGGTDTGGAADADNAPASIYKPDGIDEHMIGESNEQTIDNMNKRIKGLRGELAGKKDIPDSPDGYEFDFGDFADKIVRAGDDGKDPLLEHMKGVFHEKGIGVAEAQDVIVALYSQLQENGAFDGGEDDAVLDFEYSSFGGAEKAKSTIDACTAWSQTLDLSDGEKEEFDVMLSHDAGVTLLNKLREKAGEAPVPKDTGASAGNGGVTEADLQARMRDPKYWKEKDPAFIAKTTEMFQEFYKEG